MKPAKDLYCDFGRLAVCKYFSQRANAPETLNYSFVWWREGVLVLEIWEGFLLGRKTASTA